MSILNKLTEGIVNRDLRKEGAALLTKWEKTGLLEGLENEHSRQSMAALLENQAKELLREASTMSAGDVEGFAAVAFPIVRRVFGGLIANELVSVQPMSLPSGLIFFLDFQVANTNALTNSKRLGYDTDDSLYGGNVAGQQVTGGVDLSFPNGDEKGFYSLNQGYSSTTGSANVRLSPVGSGTVGGDRFAGIGSLGGGNAPTGLTVGGAYGEAIGPISQKDWDKVTRHDPDLSGTIAIVAKVVTASTDFSQLNLKNLAGITYMGKDDDGTEVNIGKQVRRLTTYSSSVGATDPDLYVVFAQTASLSPGGGESLNKIAWFHDVTGTILNFTYPTTDNFGQGSDTAAGAGNSLGAIVGKTAWGLENETSIPEIDIKVDSVSITAVTKKLKAKWTPELGQDLNAYHNLDAEVELTSILSEQIALEIDRELLEDLVKGASAATYYWSRRPGKFLDRETGQNLDVDASTLNTYPDFTGTVSEWYETLVETINDVSAQIHRKTLRGGANFLVVSPETANLLEFTSGFRANITADEGKGTVGAVKTGNLSKKWDVWVDPYFPRNVVLVGRRGGSFLESGFVYAPYVPLQVTPTIFGIEDFVPRKGVMTRYAKKMVRPDMYGLVVIYNLMG